MSNVFECIPFIIGEHSYSEYCSLIEEDGITAGFICYNKTQCASIVNALANSRIAASLPRQELYSGAACLVELVFLDSNCQVVHPRYHREVESLLSQTGNIEIRTESKFNSNDWFELHELLIKQPTMKVDDLIDLLTETLGSLTCLVQRELSSEKYQYTMVMSAAGVLQMEINGIQSGDLKNNY